jgi:hypothetical protein
MDDDPLLRTVSEPVTDFAEATVLIRTMKEALRERGGRGLAAVQIGVPLRVIIVREPDFTFRPMINPTLDRTLNRFAVEREGCLSIPPSVAVPNAAKRSQWAAQRAKREGMATGFPDILCFWKGPGVAAIEFKTATGKLSENQVEWLDRLEDIGIPVTVSRDADHAVEFLRQCGAPFIGRIDCGREKVIPSKDVTRTTKPTLNCGCARRVEGRRYASRKSWGDNVILHYGNKCQICGWAEARCDVHHRIPRSEGGPHTLANAVVLCPNCHRVQHEKERRCER